MNIIFVLCTVRIILFILWLWNLWLYFNLFPTLYEILWVYSIWNNARRVFFLVSIGFRKAIIQILDIYLTETMFYAILIFLFFANHDWLCESFI